MRSLPSLAKTIERSRLRASYRLHRSLTNASSRRAFESNRPALDGARQEVLEGLRRQGIATVSFSDLVGDQELWAQLEREMGSFVADAEEKVARADTDGERKKEDFIIRGGASRKRPLAAEDPWLRYAVSDPVLGIANAYLGLQSKLTYLDKWYTAPSPPDAGRVGSQRWHRDPIDRRIVKVFTYFSDVDRDAGAMEYVRGSAAGGPYGDLWPWRPRSGERYPPDGELERQVPERDRVVAEGLRGTVVFVDTAGFHRGGYAVEPRVTSIFTYVSPASLATSLAKRRYALADGAAERLSPPARFATE